MAHKNLDYFDKTILNTPKPTASSTVGKKPFKTRLQERSHADLENSLEISMNSADLSKMLEERTCQNKNSHSVSNINYHLQQQRVLANNSLDRANKVAGIPSKYLKSNITKSETNSCVENESSISESDLLKTPATTSTPRNSVDRQSLIDSMAQLSFQIGNTDISIDNFAKEFQKAMQNSANTDAPKLDSNMFTPAEDMGSVLLADELSWRRQNEIPVLGEAFSHLNMSSEEVSFGEFFQKRSDNLSNFTSAKSPVKTRKPVPLINSSISFPEEKNGSTVDISKNKSLSISAIQKFLAESNDTPRKAVNYLFNRGRKSDIAPNSSVKNLEDNSSLPVSKNSSYTSAHSDNEAIHHILNKENIEALNKYQNELACEQTRPISKSPAPRGSSRASSTLTSLPSGKLPIESTKCDLIWGCVKVDKCVTQDFLLRNRTSKRLALQMSVSEHNFKVRKENRLDSEPLSSMKMLLHPHESKAIFVSFIPTKIGAAVDELKFTSIDPKLKHTQKQCVRLFGYGGYSKIDFHDLAKDITGKIWLSLGKLDSHSVMEQTFYIGNSGVLPAFVHLSFRSKEFFKINVAPNFFILLPQERKQVIATYVPTIDDYKTLLKSFSNAVADLGSLLVTSGTEVNRGRLRRLCRKCNESGISVDPLSNILKEKIQGEAMPPDLVRFKETTDNLKEILKLFNRSEIVLTVERDPDQTIIPQYPDESGFFHSLCQDSTVLGTEKTVIHSSCHLVPSTIFLTLPSKSEDSLFLISDFGKTLHYQVTSEPEGLEIEPKEGILVPGQQIILALKYPRLCVQENMDFKVFVYVENEVFQADVKVIFIGQARSKLNI